MNIILQLIFAVALGVTAFLFAKRIKFIRRNILLGRDLDRSDRKDERWKLMFKVAVGQSKMVVNPIAGALHIVVYLGFLIVNVEMIEIVVDGLFGTHRFLSTILGSFYDVLVASFEFFAVGVILACAIFLIRRNVLNIKRFLGKEMTSWPKSDANIILVVEILLMSAFLIMNATDGILQTRGAEHYSQAGSFPISSIFTGIFNGMSDGALIAIERIAWWFHILGVMAFLVYVTYSKHFHTMLAFPNVWYSKLTAKGQLDNNQDVKKEVEMMLDPNADPFAAPAPDANAAPPAPFGAKDVKDLTWKSIMDGYTCTECGRCTDNCPANMTGKLLSPRKVMMDVRDRADEFGKNIDCNKGEFKEDGKSLLGDYITAEELWACTSCNACVEACPVNNDPLAVIMDLRRFLVMEESKAPMELNLMMQNIENNQAPWQFSPQDRFNWATEDD